ncbi:MAG: hypothetical protein AAFX54_07560 [Pseudomonadota bacterium]
MSSTQRFAALLAQLTLAAAAALPVIAALIWIFWDALAPLAAAQIGSPYDLTALGAGGRFAGFGVMLVGAALQAYGLLGLRRTFLEASRDRALSTAAVNGFRRFAIISLVMVFIGIVQRAALIIIFSLSDPAHQGALSIQFGTPELKALFMGLLLVFVAQVFAQGKKAQDENAAFL